MTKKIIYKAQLGALRTEFDTKFADQVSPGDTGEMLYKHQTLPGWFITRPDKNPDLIVPVGKGHYELKA